MDEVPVATSPVSSVIRSRLGAASLEDLALPSVDRIHETVITSVESEKRG